MCKFEWGLLIRTSESPLMTITSWKKTESPGLFTIKPKPYYNDITYTQPTESGMKYFVNWMTLTKTNWTV